MNKLSREELHTILTEDGMEHAIPQINKWLARGDGVAVYENVELGHPHLGHLQFLSFGSEAAQIEKPEPPRRMPDIGTAINWRYQLVATYQGDPL